MKRLSLLLLFFFILTIFSYGATVKLKKVTLTITGMACEECVKTVTKSLSGLAGVKDVKVTLEPQEAVIQYDESKVKVDAMIKAVKDTGFGAKLKK
jgi:copper chaperone CopZ